MAYSNRLEDLKAYARSRGWRWEPGKPVPYGEQIVIQKGQDRATATYYPKRQIIVPGGAASPLMASLKAWIDGSPAETPPPAPAPINVKVSAPGRVAVPKKEVSLKREGVPAFDALAHVGMDESGKGDLFGPLVLAAAYVTPEDARRLRVLGVRDSKEIAPGSIRQLAGEIRKRLPEGHYRVRALMPEEYNRLYAEAENLNRLLAETYAEIAAGMRADVSTETFLCDQFAQRKDRLESAFRRRGLPAPLQQTRAESASTAVAAASVLASAAFTEAMEQLGREAGLAGSMPKGASAIKALNAAARTILRREGRAGLGRYAKLHFKPVQEWMNSSWG